MTVSHDHRKKRQKGTALIATFGVLALVSVAAVSYVSSATQSIRTTNRQVLDVQTTHLCEAGIQAVLRDLWRPFKINQTFVDMEARCGGASIDTPRVTLSGTVGSIGSYSAGVIGYVDPNNDPYKRLVTVRAVGWVDRNGNGQLDSSEPRKIVDVTARFELARSQVFDYTYFVNNYGWMDGFDYNELYVNGDMRANGNFTFSNGLPTVNGSVIAANNDKLTPAAPGLVNIAPVKWSNSKYRAAAANQPRWRPGYSEAEHGAYGTAQFASNRDFIFDSSEGPIVSGSSDSLALTGTLSGAAIMDANGTRRWSKPTTSTNRTPYVLDTNPTEEVIMPDLSEINRYINQSQTYVDTKASYLDGTPNPNYGQGAWVKVWNSTTGSYQTVSSNGVVTGSADLVGTSDKPILIHGPVTFTQDCVIKGYVSGQGTIYTGRNVHIVGSIRYKNPPDFRATGGRTTQDQIDAYNEKRDIIALAARGSVIMGNPSKFTTRYPLQYMTPPFTKGRYDENGNWIPPFDANQVDGTGFKKYKSVMGDAKLNSLAETITQIDAILYTNFVGGGNVGGGGATVYFNGSIISKDEAMVVFSLPMYMNYDSRIRERGPDQKALIDLELPRSPIMLRSTWQDRGFGYGN